MVYHLTSSIPRLCWILCCLIGVSVAPAQAAQPSAQAPDPDAAAASVAGFHAALLEAAQVSLHAERETLLKPEIEAVFDVRRIAAISLGRTWRSLAEAQQDAFVDLLTALVVATYADRFDSYSGQRFVTDEVAAVKSGFVVHTRLVREAQEDVSLNYFLREGRVFNVVADGVSDLSLRRADYNSIIKNQGYDALLTHINEKIDLARSGG